MLALLSTQNDKYSSLYDRAKRLIGSSTAQLWIDIVNQRNWFIAIDVFNSLHQLEHLTPNKYNWINHNMNTRGNKSLLCFSKVKTEMFRQSVPYQGAANFDKLPRELREEPSIVRFKNKLRDYYRKT